MFIPILLYYLFSEASYILTLKFKSFSIPTQENLPLFTFPLVLAAAQASDTETTVFV